MRTPQVLPPTMFATYVGFATPKAVLTSTFADVHRGSFSSLPCQEAFPPLFLPLPLPLQPLREYHLDMLAVDPIGFCHVKLLPCFCFFFLSTRRSFQVAPTSPKVGAIRSVIIDPSLALQQASASISTARSPEARTSSRPTKLAWKHLRTSKIVPVELLHHFCHDRVLWPVDLVLRHLGPCRKYQADWDSSDSSSSVKCLSPSFLCISVFSPCFIALSSSSSFSSPQCVCNPSAHTAWSSANCSPTGSFCGGLLFCSLFSGSEPVVFDFEGLSFRSVFHISLQVFRWGAQGKQRTDGKSEPR